MTDLEGIAMTSREGETEEPVNPADEDPLTRTGKNAKGKWKNSSGVDDSRSSSPSGQNRGDLRMDGNGNGERVEQSAVGQKKVSPTAEDHRARFYETYRQEAEDYDKEFIKNYDEDLNTSLIFAGLFSAVTSAFIIEVNSELKPDPNEETAALLRILIYKMDNTTFGGDVPAAPQWTGPPRMIIHVQAILFASLAASLFSAFLAMLGKQWLNRYASVDVRGSAIERSQNRQRKLDGIVNWYFDHVMQTLPLMLQAALLLLGCALSRYLWEINTTVASVVLSVTLLGLLFYLFIIIAGAASVSCPYQTPGAHILRYTFRCIPHIPGALRTFAEESLCYFIISSGCNTSSASDGLFGFFFLPVWFIVDVCRAVRWLSIFFSRGVYLWSQRVSELPMAVLDLHCISWSLQTSLDGPVRLSTLNYLATATQADFDPAIVADCFGILIGCIKVIDGEAVITQGMEQLVPATVLCCLHAAFHTGAGQRLGHGGSVHRQYFKAFPHETNFNALPSSHILGSIHRMFYEGHRFAHGMSPQWEDYKPSNDEQAIVAHVIAKIFVARTFWKVPRWALRFALHSLSQSPLPSTSVIISCLSIITADLGCDPSNIATLDKSAQLDELSSLITQKVFESTFEGADRGWIYQKCKAISALLPYAVFLEQGGQRGMLDAISRVARVFIPDYGGLLWYRVQPFVTTLFKKPNPPSLGWVLGLISAHAPWHHEPHDKNMVARRAVAVSHPEGVCWSVADELLCAAFVDSAGPLAPPMFLQRPEGTWGDITRQVRILGDIEILTSYFCLVWSELGPIDDRYGGLTEVLVSIREDFGGIGMGRHREDLTKRLDSILKTLNSGDLWRHHIRFCVGSHPRTKEQYEELKRVVLEVDEESVNVLTKSHMTFMCALPLQ